MIVSNQLILYILRLLQMSKSIFTFIFFFKHKTAYELGLGIPAEPLFRSPNFGRRVRNRRQLNSLQNTWPYGYSMPIAVRYTQDAFSRSGCCGLLMLKVSRLKLPVIWLLVSMWLNTLTKSQIWTLLLKV